MSHDVNIVWVMPWENLTEDRFASTMRSLVGLPLTEVYVYEPEQPEAHLFSTVKIPFEQQMIQGAPMWFNVSRWQGDSYGFYPLPKHLGFLRADWIKRAVCHERPFNELLTDTIARIAEGMGAVYSAYYDDYDRDRLKTLDEFLHYDFYYHFFSWPLVEIVGRPRIENLGKIVEVSNGLSLFQHGKEQRSNLRGVLKDIWSESDLFEGEYLNERPDGAPSGEAAQLIDESTRSKPEYYEIWPDEDSTFFICFYPVKNHTKENYQAFIDEVTALEMKDPELKGRGKPYNEGFVKQIIEENRGDLTFTIPPDERRIMGAYDSTISVQSSCTYEIELISGVPEEMSAEAPFDIPRYVTALFTNGGGGLGTQYNLINLMTVFSRHFEPTFGFWVTDIYDLWSNRERMDPPERCIWPLVMYGRDNLFRHRKKLLKPYLVRKFLKLKSGWQAYTSHEQALFLFYNQYYDNDYDLSDQESQDLFSRLSDLVDQK